MKVKDPAMFQVRRAGDNDYSVMARVWVPQKKFYEHPTYIELSKEEAQIKCDEFIKNPISVDEVTKNWVYIGD